MRPNVRFGGGIQAILRALERDTNGRIWVELVDCAGATEDGHWEGLLCIDVEDEKRERTAYHGCGYVTEVRSARS